MPTGMNYGLGNSITYWSMHTLTPAAGAVWDDTTVMLTHLYQVQPLGNVTCSGIAAGGKITDMPTACTPNLVAFILVHWRGYLPGQTAADEADHILTLWVDVNGDLHVNEGFTGVIYLAHAQYQICEKVYR